MDKQERLAREWAEKAKEAAPRMAYTPESVAAYEFILANTKPLTMADVEWDEDKHYLAGCMSPYGSMVMLRPQGVNVIVHDLNSDLTEVFDSDDLTPNGKRYELVEVTEAKHPVVLETLQGYDDAPDGTIIAAAHGAPWVKEVGEWFVGDKPATSESIAYQPRIVLRWGWGE